MAVPVEIPAPSLRRRLAIALDHVDMTDEDMAQYLGVHPTTVAKWLKGQRNPKRPALIAWASRCSVPLEWLEGEGGTTRGITRRYRPARPRYQVLNGLALAGL